jgi:hypothetical protein
MEIKLHWLAAFATLFMSLGITLESGSFARSPSACRKIRLAAGLLSTFGLVLLLPGPIIFLVLMLGYTHSPVDGLGLFNWLVVLEYAIAGIICLLAHPTALYILGRIEHQATYEKTT